MGDAEQLAKMSTIQMGIRVPSPLYEKLTERAVQVRASKTEVVLTALAQYLDSGKDAPLAVRVSELETKVEELQSLMKKLTGAEV